MTTVLFVTHPQEECGVHQFGKLVFSALAPSQKYSFVYRQVTSPEEVRAAVAETSPRAVLVNWHPITMSWASQSTFWDLGVPAIGIMHEVTEGIGNQTTDAQFDYYITHDPSARFGNSIYFSSARPVPAFDGRIEPPARTTIGTFGFATPGKGFEGLVARINAEFDDCVIRINMPNSYFCDADGALAREVAERCRALITKPNIELKVSHDFLSIDGIISFLAGNSLNAFFYEAQDSRGISSAVDLAIAAGRPIALRRVSMFRHMFDAAPSVFVEDRTLQEILGDATPVVAGCRERWSLDQVRRDYEAVLDGALQQWASNGPASIRAQWMRRVMSVEENLRRESFHLQHVAQTKLAELTALQQSTQQAADQLEMVALKAMQEGAAARLRVEQFKKKNKNLKRSLSWRATRPFRRAARIGRKLFPGLWSRP